MGLASDTIEMMIRLHEGGVITRPTNVIEIGAQQLSNSFLRARTRMEHLGSLFGVTAKLDLPAPQQAAIVDGGIEHMAENAPWARQFWEWLGFEYAAIDIDGSPNSIPLDLNFDDVPQGAKKKFGLVTNFGTTEHVANQLNAFKVIHELTASDGVMIHSLPAQGFVNHGLINYNPKWFWMLARSNEYRWCFFDYCGSDQVSDLPSNVIEAVAPYRPDVGQRATPYRIVDGSLAVIFQKVRDFEFIPPLDVTTGTKTTNAALIDRYWTIFAPERAHGEKAPATSQ
jgi:Methyltransferase domain